MGDIFSLKKLFGRSISPKEGIDISINARTAAANKKKNDKKKNKKSKTERIIKFYNEEQIILEEFKHIQTPKAILDAIEEIINQPEKQMYYDYDFYRKFNSSATDFVRTSYSYKNITHEKCEMPSFHHYYATFQDMDFKQRQWYLYWRERTLHGEYLETDLSYLYVFLYELINYSFNQNAAFNISMIKRLYDAYKEQHHIKRLEGVIADFLFEVGERELGEKWFQPKPNIPPLYKQLKEKELDISRISITLWKGYYEGVNFGNSKFYAPNKNKIYKTFKDCIHLLEKHYKEKEGKRLVDVYFETKTETVNHTLFNGLVSFRKSYENPIQFEVENTYPTKLLYQQISQYARLSENVTRILNGENRQIKCDEAVLPSGLKEEMIAHLSAPKEQGRFKTVQQKKTITKGSAIPPKPVEETKVDIQFDDERIQQLATQSEQLVDEVEKRSLEYEENAEELKKSNIEHEQKEEKTEPGNELVTETNNGLDNFFFGGGEVAEEDIVSFVEGLSELELVFLSKFNEDLEWSKEEANQFLKSKGTILSVFISQLNEKSQEQLEDNLLEEDGGNLVVFEEFNTVVVLAKERI